MNSGASFDNSSLPLVSAVITTHNRLPLLKKALQSVADQSYENIEVVVVDDASTDDTKDYMESENPVACRYVHIPPEKSKGGNHARNVGVSLSRGEWVAFLDDDDEWFTDKIKRQVECAAENPGCGMVGCRRIVEFDNGARTSRPDYLHDGDMSEEILTGIPYTTSMIMVRRTTLLEIGGFDEQLTHWQEYEMQIRLCQVATVAAVDDNLVLYRSYRENKSRLSNQLERWLAAVERICSKHKDLLDSSSEETRHAFNLLIVKDGIVRADRVGNRAILGKFLKAQYELEPNVKNWLKMKLRRAGLRPWRATCAPARRAINPR